MASARHHQCDRIEWGTHRYTILISARAPKRSACPFPSNNKWINNDMTRCTCIFHAKRKYAVFRGESKMDMGAIRMRWMGSCWNWEVVAIAQIAANMIKIIINNKWHLNGFNCVRGWVDDDGDDDRKYCSIDCKSRAIATLGPRMEHTHTNEYRHWPNMKHICQIGGSSGGWSAGAGAASKSKKRNYAFHSSLRSFVVAAVVVVRRLIIMNGLLNSIRKGVHEPDNISLAREDTRLE